MIELPRQMGVTGSQRRLFVHGIRIVDGVANEAIAGSGTSLGQLPRVALQYPTLAVVPRPSGGYRALAEHPRVFTTTAELKEIAARINRPASYSAQRFGQLAGQIARDLAAPNDWDAAYSGCVVTVYLYAFSYEPQDGNVMRIAGYDPYGYRGRHGQSLETAIDYYACFAKGAGFNKTVTAENSSSCPNAPHTTASW